MLLSKVQRVGFGASLFGCCGVVLVVLLIFFWAVVILLGMCLMSMVGFLGERANMLKVWICCFCLFVSSDFVPNVLSQPLKRHKTR